MCRCVVRYMHVGTYESLRYVGVGGYFVCEGAGVVVYRWIGVFP